MLKFTNPDAKFKIIPLWDIVREDEIDKSALETLISLGFDWEIAMIALKRVGTDFGA